MTTQPPYTPFVPFFPSLKSILIPQAVMDASINALGSRMGWMKSHACPCTYGNPNSNGSPNPRCKTCFGRGTYWDEPIPLIANVTFMHTSSAPDEPGAVLDPVMGAAMRAAPTLSIPYTNADGSLCIPWQMAAEKDAYVATDSIIRVNTPLVAGDTTYLPYKQNLVVQDVTYYDATAQRALPVATADYTVTGASVVLNPDVYQAGTAYVVEYTASIVYVAFRASGGISHSRPAGSGANLPKRFHLELLDVWTRNLNNPAAQSAVI